MPLATHPPADPLEDRGVHPEVLRLEALGQHEEADAFRLAELRRIVAEAQAEFDRGEYVTVDASDTLAWVMRHIDDRPA